MQADQSQSPASALAAAALPALPRLVWVTTPADLVCIYDDDVIAVVWRDAVSALDDAVLALPAPMGRIVLDARAGALRCLGHGSLLHIVEVFALLADTADVGVRWRTARAAMCPQFHVDRVELRACLTLRGPGTELQIGGQVVSTRAGDLVVMKGTLLDSLRERGGCWHRSPPQDDGAERVVVTLDIVTPETTFGSNQ
ncbi:MAG: DUF1826 domain-containing protein [Deltaproteobacteria bacterium]|nr:DUF1826 domain-containing protein [Deltaproteobacteria bacterium]